MTRTGWLLAGMLLFGGIAAAETTDTTLAAPGCYIGTGCDQNGWDVSTVGNTELGLAAIIRYQGAPGEGSNPGSIDGNTYYVPSGPGTSPTLALWNFQYSMNTHIGQTTDSLSNYTYLLTITNLTTSATGSFDPSAIGDNNTQGNWGAQNSENLGWFVAGFDPNATDNYKFQLTESQGQSVVNSATVFVDVVAPEPSTLSMAGLSIIALALFRRRQMMRRG